MSRMGPKRGSYPSQMYVFDFIFLERNRCVEGNFPSSQKMKRFFCDFPKINFEKSLYKPARPMLVRVKRVFILQADGRSKPSSFARRALFWRVSFQIGPLPLSDQAHWIWYFGSGPIALRCRKRSAIPRGGVPRCRRFSHPRIPAPMRRL